MHIPHMLLVEAESHEDAVSMATMWVNQEDYNPCDWSDWSEVGGRWAGMFDDKDTVCYAENAELFDKHLQEFQETIQQTKERYLSEVGDMTISEIMLMHDNDKYGLDLYRAQRVLQLVGGEYNHDKQIYDTVEYTSNLEAFRKRCADNPAQQYAVVWDFHF